MECKRDGCQVELQGRQRDFCSDRCRKAQSRTNKRSEDGLGSPNADKAGQIPTPDDESVRVEGGQDERGQTENSRPLPDEAYIDDVPNYLGADCDGCEKSGEYRAANCGPNCMGAHRQRQGVTEQDKTDTPAVTIHEQQCAANNRTRSKDNQHTINTGSPKSFDELDKREHNRVSLPGDGDYDGCVAVGASPMAQYMESGKIGEFAGPALQTAGGMTGSGLIEDGHEPRQTRV